MNNFTFILNGNTVPAPDNWMNLLVQLSFMDDDPEGALNATKLVWKGTNAKIINQWLADGLNGGLGIYEGIPFQIQVCNSNLVVFNGICDLSHEDTKFNCDIVQITLRDQREDMIKQLFSSISFSYLATPVQNGGPAPGAWSITSNDYIEIPYQVNTVPDYFDFLLCVNSIMHVINQIEKIVKEVVGMITSGLTTFSSILGIPAAVGFVIEVIYWLIELSINISCVIDLVSTGIYELVGYNTFGGSSHHGLYSKYGMNVLLMMQKACAYFGLGFESTLMETQPLNRLYIMPEKGAWANNQSFASYLFQAFTGQGFGSSTRKMYDDPYNLQNGGFAYGYFDGSISDLFQQIGDVFNAKPRIILDAQGNPVLHFEVWDAIVLNSGVTMPNISEDAPFPQPFQTNASELASNYLIQYSKDSTDANTYDTYDGTICQAQFQPINVGTRLNVTLQNLVNKQFAFAQGVRKTQATLPELIFQDVTSVVNGIVGTVTSTINEIGKLINDVTSLLPGNLSLPSPLIQNFNFTFTPQIGVLLLTDNTTGVPKLLLLNNDGTLDSTNHTANDPIGCRKLMKNYHYSSLMLTEDPNGNPYWNQFYVYKSQTIPLCCEDFVALYNTNYITTYDGNQARVDSLKYNPFKAIATIDYRVRTKFTNNLQVSYMIDNGTTLNSASVL